LTGTPDHRLDELFVRYWDNALTPAEADELATLLAADPRAMELFQLYCVQAVTVAELPVFGPPAVDPRTGNETEVARAAKTEVSTTVPAVMLDTAPGSRGSARGWSRRGLLGVLGGGLAAAITVGLLGRYGRNPKTADTAVRIRDLRGSVTIQDAAGRSVPPTRPLPAGAWVSTYGLGSSVVLAYPDGTGVTLTGETVVSVPGDSRVRVYQGAVSAAVPPQAAGAEPFTVLTPQVILAGLSGVLVTLGERPQETEVAVHRGLVSAQRPNGEPMAVVRPGETLTVGPDGEHRKCRTPVVPEEFAWDLNAPLPDSWWVGRRETTAEGPVVVPESWPDPYWRNTRMYQIRSNGEWTRGFFRMAPDSLVRVRYRVEREGLGQFCLCVRTDNSACPDTGVLEWNGTYGAPKVGEWQWLEVRAADMLDNKNAPKFGDPWIGFLVIFNTYVTNLGLEVAEFRVSRPGGPANH
jgi:hypothetical protein